MRLRMVLAALVLILAASPARAGFEDMENRVREHVLENGMRFLILERHDAPVVSFTLVVNVGSVNEHVGITGVAHVFEHMAFKGSTSIGVTDAGAEGKALAAAEDAFLALRAERDKAERADPARVAELEAAFQNARHEADQYAVNNEFSVIYERNGATGLNAGTSADDTTYWVNFPSNKVELWFSMEGDRFVNPVMREFYQEKEVVMEERRMRTDSQPSGRLFEEFLSAAFKAHTYGSPTIGHQSDLEHLGRREAEAFFRTYYIPNNTTAAIVGDVDAEQIIRLAEQYFGPWKRGANPPAVTTVEPPQQGEKRITVHTENEPLVIVGYHRPGVRSPDDPVYDVLDDILSGGRSSRLYKAMVKEKRNALGVGSFTGMPGNRYPNLFCFYGVPAVGHTTEDMEESIQEVIDQLIAGPLSSEELDGVKTRVRADFIRGLDSNDGLANQLASAQALYGDWRELFRTPAKIAAVTAEDVKRVAEATFAESNRTVGVLVNPHADEDEGDEASDGPDRSDDHENDQGDTDETQDK